MNYVVDEGDWLRFDLYRGDSLFRAGLAAARGRRDALNWSMSGLDSIRVWDLDGVDEDTDGLSDEEREFIDRCLDAGKKAYEKPFAIQRRSVISARRNEEHARAKEEKKRIRLSLRAAEEAVLKIPVTERTQKFRAETLRSISYEIARFA